MARQRRHYGHTQNQAQMLVDLGSSSEDAEEYTVTWECDDGMASVQVKADDIEQVAEIMVEAFPEDQGADGMITDNQGEEHPIGW